MQANIKAIEVKWVFKVKNNLDGSTARHMTMLVAIGFLQRAGLDYSKVYTVFAKLETIILVVDFACKQDWSTFHLDAKSSFLNGPLDKLMYVTQPLGFVIQGEEK